MQLMQLPILPLQLLPTHLQLLFIQLPLLLPLLHLSLMGSGMPLCMQRPLLSPTE